MIEVRAPRPGEVEAIAARAAEPWARQAAAAGFDFTALVDRPLTYVALWEGLPFAAGGYIDFGNRVAVAWSSFGPPPPGVLLPLVRLVRRRLAESPFNWIEAHCVRDFQPAIRWVEAIGMVPLHAVFEMNGHTFNRYVWRR